MGKFRLGMTGEQVKQVLEQDNINGRVDTLPEVFALFEGIGDDEKLEDYIARLTQNARLSDADRQLIEGVKNSIESGNFGLTAFERQMLADIKDALDEDFDKAEIDSWFED